jgi:two-component system, OmpR family, phosphate regulon response regulator PhoB
VSGEPRPLVLVAEDDEDILKLVVFDLEAEGFEVVTARDGEQALRLALDQRPDLAILDVVMPALGGDEVARRIRDSEALDGTAVILLTARSQLGDIVRGFETGADDYLTKPFDPVELRACVHALVRRRESLRRKRTA